MKKKGQMSLFAVLGIVIVTVVVLAILFRSQITETISELEIVKSEKIKIEEAEIKAYASDCLKKTTEEGIQRVLASGGYYNNAEHSVQFYALEVPHYLFEGKEYVPKLKEIEKNLASYIKDNNAECLAAYYRDLEIGEADVEVEFDGKIKVGVKQDLVLKTEEIRVKVSRYNAEVNFNIKEVYNPMLEFYAEVKNISESDFLNQGYLALEEKYEFYTETLNDQETIFVLEFENVLEEEKDIDCMFAMKYPKVEAEAFGDVVLKLEDGNEA